MLQPRTQPQDQASTTATHHRPTYALTMDDLVTWLRAQLDKDERVARGDAVRATSPSPWRREYYAAFMHAVADADGRELFGKGHLAETQDVQHIVRWDPARVVAEVDAKRRILRLYENALNAHRAGSISQRNRTQDEAAVDVLGETVRLLALPYADRHGWREEWRA